MDIPKLEPCPKCGGNPCVNARMDWNTYLLNWCIGCADCGTYGTLHIFDGPEKDKANLILAAEEWNAMCKGMNPDGRGDIPMNACYCSKCGSVFPMGARFCERCSSTESMVELKAGKFLPVSFYNNRGIVGWYRDPDFGKRWVTIPVGDETALVEPDTAAKMIMIRGKRVKGPYDPETMDSLVTCKDDWETADGMCWTLRWTIALAENTVSTNVRCEVVE